MNDLPNLDYNILNKLLNKKSQIGYGDPEEELQPQPQRRTTAPTSGMNKLQKEMEVLKEQYDDARSESRYDDVTKIKRQIKKLENLMDDVVNSPQIQQMVESQRPPEDIYKAIDSMIEGRRTQEKMEGIPLEDQLEQAIKDERYEDAAKMRDQLKRLKELKVKDEEGEFVKLMNRKVLERIVITAEDIDLVEINKPYDETQPKYNPSKRHRFRFRNEPQGQDELFWDGMGGTLQKDKGIGTDQYQDVGSPASINLAKSRWQRFRPTEVNLPNEKMERNPLEEKQVTETWLEYNNMQQR